MDASKAYTGIPRLLQMFINENDSQVWKKITEKTDYMYLNLDDYLGGLKRETGFGNEIWNGNVAKLADSYLYFVNRTYLRFSIN